MTKTKTRPAPDWKGIHPVPSIFEIGTLSLAVPVYGISMKYSLRHLHGVQSTASPWSTVYGISMEYSLRHLHGVQSTASPWSTVYGISMEYSLRHLHGVQSTASPWSTVYGISIGGHAHTTLSMLMRQRMLGMQIWLAWK